MPVKTQPYPWLKFYPEGIPHEINPDAYPSLLELMDEGFKRYAGHSAYSCMGKEITFGELDTYTRNFAAYLQSVGLQKGDRLVIQMPNCLQYPVAMFGALRAGLIIVNTNPLYTPREMEHQFKDSGAKAIVIVANFASNLEKVIDKTAIKHVFVTQLGDMLGFPKKQLVNFVVKTVKKMVPAYNLPQAMPLMSAVGKGSNLNWSKPKVTSSDLAFIQYTGGTTGVSKGAMLTHRNIVANLEANNIWQSVMTNKIKDDKVVVVAALPLYHIYALTVNALTSLKTGTMNLLITNPRDLNAFIKDLKKNPPHVFTGLNTLYNGLLNHPKINEVDFSKLVITSAGGMALQGVVANRWKDLTGNLPAEGYGLSETSPVLTSNPLVGENRIGTIGIPWPSTEIRVLKEDGTWGGPGEVGEICANGPQVMAGYYNRPDETEKVMLKDADGRDWFKTGDVGVMDDDGYFKIVDRKKDMILVSGFNVYPNEIEDVVATCPGVLEVACIGVPDEKSTEAVKVFIVKKDPELTAEQVKAYCKQNLTGYKCPKHIEFRTELPKTNVGKILRRALKEEELAKK
ncbi:AMP-binding protein [Emticicia sp. TH156]|uniref:AMP-binding protein n=1 Tax=Emticicia sp. TH156 TaxID=2067454 RepID=UPI000C76F541|nr:AMP-binding protein [Emticicia sp. TH156]PLK46061.1 long-chain-fatty-acid--CoA ligase [Emticicia sp. TH156]